MEFINPIEMVRAAREGGYGIPAFNTNGANYEITRAALEIAEEMRSPLILQVYEPNCEYRGYEFFVEQSRLLSRSLGIGVPVALQLDHGHSFQSVLQAMRAGFTSVMFDASHEPLEANINETRRVVEVAHALGVAVEAEVGYVKGNEPKTGPQVGRVAVPERPTIPPTRTEPSEAARFVSEVDVDMLAVSVGTTHGVYRTQDRIDYELLSQLRSAIDIPLVQHGTSGIGPDDLTRLVGTGMTKVNFGEPFRFSYIEYFNDLTDSSEHQWHSWRIMRDVKDRLKNDMRVLIEAIGSDGKVP